ncbi:MAG: hypothetical protein ABIF71_13720 [Planctomycetota bacterium]
MNAGRGLIVGLLVAAMLVAPAAVQGMNVPSCGPTAPAAAALTGGAKDPMLAHKGDMVKAGVTMIVIVGIVAAIQLTDSRGSNDTSGYLYLALALAGTAGVVMGAE